MRLFRPFLLLRLLYPEAVFRLNRFKMVLYLTFDDGPQPDTTPRILNILEAHGVKATFFCTGQEAEKYPGLIRLIVSKGHIIGNHGYYHIDGWKTNNLDYLENTLKAAKYTSSCLFRPPYGRIRPSQYRVLKKNHRIVFWDLMPYDFDRKMDHQRILRILKSKMRPGSVIVFHDKGTSTALTFLEQFVRHAGDEGYKFLTLPIAGNR